MKIANCPPRKYPLCLAPLTIMMIVASAFIAPDSGQTDSSKRQEAQQECRLNLTAGVCDDCIRFVHETRLGSVDGPGYLTDSGQSNSIVRDLDGNYWVGQGDYINVYGPTGAFIQSVGQRGEGPLDFRLARPKYVDSGGRVHVQDNLNLRVSIIDADFGLIETIRLPLAQVNDLVALDNGRRYAIQAWGQDAETLGLPVHIVDGRGIESSFGAEYDSRAEARVFNPTEALYLATDQRGTIYVAPEMEYTVEAWSRAGERVGSTRGPDLDNDPRDAVTPPNTIRDIHVDADGLLWIMLAYRRSDWKQNSVEVAAPNGDVRLVPKDMSLFNWIRSRIDVIDLASCSVRASQWQDEIFLGFVADGLVSDGEYSPVGAPLINIKRLVLTEARGATR